MELALARPAMAVASAAEAFGDRMQPLLASFRSVLKASADLETSPSSSSSGLEKLLDDMDEAVEGLSPTDVLFYHVSLLATAASALAWVFAPDPPPTVVQAAKDEASEGISKLRAMSHASNAALADAIEAFLERLLKYVTDNAPTPIAVGNGRSSDVPRGREVPVASAAAAGSVKSSEKPRELETSAVTSTPSGSGTEAHTAPHLVHYREDVLSGCVAKFESAASAVGGVAVSAATSFGNAMRVVYDYMVEASTMSAAPDEDGRQKMLEPIIAQMKAVADTANDCAPSDPLLNHLKALEEGVALVGWIVQDSKPTAVVSDADASAAFYLNKVLMSTKKGDSAAMHKSFVDTLRNVFAETKGYIKEYHTMGLRYNTGLTAAKGAECETSPVASGVDDNEQAESYVTAFQALIDGPLADFIATSNAVGGEVAEQAKPFAEAWQAEAEFLSKAINMPKPDDFQDMLAPIAAKMTAVGAVTEKMDPRGPLAQHCNAVSESIPALGWVAVDEKATGFVGDMAGAGQFFVDKVKMGARKTDNPDAHRAWAKALETLFSDLKAYVKEHHTQKLVWNPPKVAVKAKRPRNVAAVDDDDLPASDYVSAFKELIDGPLAAFVKASNDIGGDVAKQAASFAAAWNAEAEFLGKAINMPKPDDAQDLLAPVAAKMGEVSAVTESSDPRGPFAAHLSAVGESVGALGWIAIEEKATGFVGDMAGAGQFFVDKVKMAAKKADNPETHRAWANALENLFADLKAYVKEHHTQKLVWNPPKAARGARSASASHADNGDFAVSDYVTAFKELISGPLAAYVSASNVLGGELAEQAALFAGAWEAEEDFLAKAINMAKPEDFQDMLAPIAAKMGEVAAITEKVDPRGPLAQHCNAVSEATPALGWVAVDEKATAFVGDMSGAGQFFIDKVKMGAKKTDNPDAHRVWAKALEALFVDLKAYVKEYHTQKLVWNPPKAAVKRAARSSGVASEDSGSATATDYVVAFEALIAGPLTAFVDASKAIGGEVAEQAASFAGAWQAEAEFLKRAIKMPKPDDVQSMLTSIAEKMGEVSAVTEKVDPRGSLAQHCNAVSESIPALGWVAVDEKATAFVGDMAGAGQFFVDKVKMAARKTDNPDLHRVWAKALETLFTDLKSYVKEYHTQRLVWNAK